jgi:hypothetical protein
MRRRDGSGNQPVAKLRSLIASFAGWMWCPDGYELGED